MVCDGTWLGPMGMGRIRAGAMNPRLHINVDRMNIYVYLPRVACPAEEGSKAH
jgi:hypothetical protein